MITLLVILHVFVCFILILVVLLQTGKGADLAGAFGMSGSQTAFGPRGATSFLSKATTWAAVIFMLTSLALYVLESRRGTSLIREPSEAAAPATPAAAPSPAEPAAGAPSPGDQVIQEETGGQDSSTEGSTNPQP